VLGRELPSRYLRAHLAKECRTERVS
jgi:hypothetical protein